MKGKAFASAAIALAFAVSLGLAAQKPNFSGAWVMDRDRSFGMPGNMQQTMIVTHRHQSTDQEMDSV